MLKVGIIGLGGNAVAHLRDIARIPELVQVVAVADLLEGPREKAMKELGVARGYASHTELLQDDNVDAVAIVLGHQLHHRLTMDALNAGRHVLVEKPMALSLEDCDEMIAAAHANRVKLMVGLTQHFHPTAVKAKEILDLGELGPIITAVSYMSKNWNYEKRRPQYRKLYGGGMWLGNGVHEVDRLTWIMGSQAMSVADPSARAPTTRRATTTAPRSSATRTVPREPPSPLPTETAVELLVRGDVRQRHAALQRKFRAVCAAGRGEKWEDVEFDRETPAFTNEWRAFAECIEQDIEPAVCRANMGVTSSRSCSPPRSWR